MNVDGLNAALSAQQANQRNPNSGVIVGWEWMDRKLGGILPLWTSFSPEVSHRLEIAYKYLGNSTDIHKVDPTIRKVQVDETRYVDVVSMVMRGIDQTHSSPPVEVRRRTSEGETNNVSSSSSQGQMNVRGGPVLQVPTQLVSGSNSSSTSSSSSSNALPPSPSMSNNRPGNQSSLFSKVSSMFYSPTEPTPDPDDISSDDERTTSTLEPDQWFWMNGDEFHPSWEQYTRRLCLKLDKASSLRKPRVRIDKERYVDLARMIQVRYDNPSRYRPIKRHTKQQRERQHLRQSTSQQEKKGRDARGTSETAIGTGSGTGQGEGVLEQKGEGSSGQAILSPGTSSSLYSIALSSAGTSSSLSPSSLMEDLRRKEEELRKRERDLEAKEDRHKEEIGALKEALNHQQTRILERHQAVKKQEMEIGTEQERLNKASTELSKQTQELETRLYELDTRSKTLQRREQQANARETSLLRKEEDLQKQEADFELLRRDLRERTSALERLEHQLQTQIQQLQTQQRDQQQRPQESDTTTVGLGGLTFRATLGIFSLEDLKEATDNFNPELIIGRGGYGPVYRGYLGTMEVAVKKLEGSSSTTSSVTQGQLQVQGDSEFIQEVAILAPCKHQSIVPLLGVCIERKERCLVYPLMKGGTLEAHLQQTPPPQSQGEEGTTTSSSSTFRPLRPLNWYRRLTILRQVAEGLLYLHGGEDENRTPVYHRDIKSANVLLDGDGYARLSDVGLARFAEATSKSGAPAVTHVVVLHSVGTYGYADPQFVGQYRASNDIYSFGVVLLEILTGFPAVVPPEKASLVTSTSFDGGPQLLVTLMKRALTRNVVDLNTTAKQFADSSAGDWPQTLPGAIARLSLDCIAEFREDRISTAQLAQALRQLSEEFSSVAPVTLEEFVIYSNSAILQKAKDAVPRVRECVICMSEDSGGCMLLPCHHASTCLNCARLLLRASGNQRKCPLCRTTIQNIQPGQFYSTFVAQPLISPSSSSLSSSSTSNRPTMPIP